MPTAAVNEVLGQVIAEQRRRVGLSQEALAFATQRHRTYVSLIERGIKSPTVRVLFELAQALQTNPSELLRQVEERL